MAKSDSRRAFRNGLFGPVLVAAILIAPGCVWRGYREPTAQSLRPSGAIPPCPRIGVQNLSPEHAAIIVEAATEACALLRSTAFREALAVEYLRETCASDRRIRGTEIHALLLQLPDFSVVARNPRRAVAVTRIRPSPSMAIQLERFQAWRAGGALRGEMIRTLVHEMTHLIPSASGQRFQDDGHNDRTCPDGGLVSYRVGDVALRIWQQRRLR